MFILFFSPQFLIPHIIFIPPASPSFLLVDLLPPETFFLLLGLP